MMGKIPLTPTQRNSALCSAYAIGVDGKHVVRLIIMKLMWAWIVMPKKYWTLVHRLPQQKGPPLCLGQGFPVQEF